jgi:tripartite-type tricarboxylate transporter receptor subunit TctC
MVALFKIAVHLLADMLRWGTRLRWSPVLVAVLTIAAIQDPAPAQDYPIRPIRLIVPYAAGGNGDILGRIVGQKLADALGKQVVIDNRPGANGIVGTDLCAKAPPDGYTLVYVSSGHATNPALYASVPYDPIKDFDAIGLAATSPLLVAVTPSLPVKSIGELIAYARAKPGTLSYGTAGTASSGHLAAILFTTLNQVDIVHVSYKSLPQATTDLIGGRIQVMYPSITSALPHVKAGRVRALAITSAQRSGLVPDLPTVAEAGVPGYEMVIWNGMLAPLRTPRPVVAKLNAHLRAFAEAPDVTARLASMGAETAYSTPAAFDAFIKNEIAKWGKILKAAGVRLD